MLDWISEQQMQELFDEDVFIENDADAAMMSKYYSDKIKYNRTLTISDTMTFACNMDCVYCFENSRKNHHTTLEISDRIDMMIRLIHLFDSDIDTVEYIFFGGEPLLNLNYIDLMCETIRSQFSNLTINFSFTSNGTLIDAKFIELCNKYHFSEIRITLDGTSKIHNARRIMKNGMPSFDLIVNNIKRLCSNTEIRVIINSVLDEGNMPCLFDMFSELNSLLGEFVLTSRIVFNIGLLCRPIVETAHTKKMRMSNSISRLNYYVLSEKLIKAGATIMSPFYAPHCLNSSEKAFVVDPNGNIFKCVTGIGSNRFLLSTYSDFNNNPMLLLRNNIRHIESSHRNECFGCEYLTMCNGGCKCQHYENGDILCRKKLLDEEVNALLHLLYSGSFNAAGLFVKRVEG